MSLDALRSPLVTWVFGLAHPQNRNLPPTLERPRFPFTLSLFVCRYRQIITCLSCFQVIHEHQLPPSNTNGWTSCIRYMCWCGSQNYTTPHAYGVFFLAVYSVASGRRSPDLVTVSVHLSSDFVVRSAEGELRVLVL